LTRQTSFDVVSACAKTYSVYEAKARLSAIVRRVGEGHRAIITLRGRPVAEIRPLAE